MTTSFSAQVASGELAGSVEPRFARVAAEFERNFRERDELGASVCVMLDGKPVVDLWGGTAREKTGEPWNADTLSVVWSSTKGAVSFCTHLLAARGELDIDAPVSDYWPEYAQNGKESTTVKMMLNHQSGVCAISEKLPPGAYADWDTMVRAIERQQPFFEPGTTHGYEALTYGWLLGEVIRRVTGKSLGTFFREAIAEPLGLDFWIGLPEREEARTARMILPEPDLDNLSPFMRAMMNPKSPQALALGNSGGYMDLNADGERNFDMRAAHAAEIGAAGGLTNGRGLAGLYAPLACGGSLNGVNFVNADTIARMGAVSSASSRDFTLLAPMRFSLGFFKAMDNRRALPGTQDSLFVPEAAFGHPGYGGSIGFADPESGISFGYSMNRMGQGMLLNPRGQSLIDAVYLSLGYRSRESGNWLK
jgi:CubicO group peptidase (beta-lactamase class C family)